jgi:hypothetical protein
MSGSLIRPVGRPVKSVNTCIQHSNQTEWPMMKHKMEELCSLLTVTCIMCYKLRHIHPSAGTNVPSGGNRKCSTSYLSSQL